MYINKDYLDFMFSGNTHYEGQSDTYFILKESLGELLITQGRIVLADPYAINYGIALSENVASGKFPVSIYSVHDMVYDEIKLASFLLQFDENVQPDDW